MVLSNNDDLIDNVSLLPPLGKSHHSTIEVLVNYSSNNSTDKFYLDYNNADFDSIQKVFNDVNYQLSYFLKTLNIAKEPLIPRKKIYINSRNRIKLEKIFRGI